MVEQADGDRGGSSSEARLRVLLEAYLDGGLDEEQLIERLSQIRDATSGTAEDSFACEVSELVARIEMIYFNICHAERRRAITEVLAQAL